MPSNKSYEEITSIGLIQVVNENENNCFLTLNLIPNNSLYKIGYNFAEKSIKMNFKVLISFENTYILCGILILKIN